jgi:hypothetical protein
MWNGKQRYHDAEVERMRNLKPVIFVCLLFAAAFN